MEARASAQRPLLNRRRGRPKKNHPVSQPAGAGEPEGSPANTERMAMSPLCRSKIKKEVLCFCLFTMVDGVVRDGSL